jgi:hypothetical protein
MANLRRRFCASTRPSESNHPPCPARPNLSFPARLAGLAPALPSPPARLPLPQPPRPPSHHLRGLGAGSSVSELASRPVPSAHASGPGGHLEPGSLGWIRHEVGQIRPHGFKTSSQHHDGGGERVDGWAKQCKDRHVGWEGGLPQSKAPASLEISIKCYVLLGGRLGGAMPC